MAKKILCNIFVLFFIMISTAYAAKIDTLHYDGADHKYTGPEVTLMLNQKEFEVTENLMPPIILENRTLVPVREVFEKLGGDVAWDAKERRVDIEIGVKKISLWIDKTEALVDGETIEVDVPAKIINSKTIVPARFISEQGGLKVDWEQETKTVSIDTPLAKIKSVEFTTIDDVKCVVVSADSVIYAYTYTMLKTDGYHPYVDIENSKLVCDTTAKEIDDSLISKIRFGIHENQKNRIVLDITEDTDYIVVPSSDRTKLYFAMASEFTIPGETLETEKEDNKNNNNINELNPDVKPDDEKKEEENTSKDTNENANQSGENKLPENNEVSGENKLPENNEVSGENKSPEENQETEDNEILDNNQTLGDNENSGDNQVSDEGKKEDKEDNQENNNNENNEEEEKNNSDGENKEDNSNDDNKIDDNENEDNSQNIIVPDVYIDSIKYSTVSKRVKIGYDGDIEYKHDIYTNPNKIVIDIQNAELKVDGPKEINLKGNVITSIRFSQYNDDEVRVVLDLSEKVDYKIYKRSSELQVAVSQPTYKNISYKLNAANAQLTLIDVDIDDLTGTKSSKSDKYTIKYSSKDFDCGEGELELEDDFVDKITISSSRIVIYDTGNMVYTMRQSGSNVVVTIKQEEDEVTDKKVILIDPGHGGSDPGACNGKAYEKVYNLNISLMLYELLAERNDVEVYMSRDDDTYLNREDRIAIATELKPDFIVSVHNNSLENKSYTGTMVLYYNNDTESQYGDITSKECAQIVLNKLIDALGTVNRGVVNRKDLHILSKTPCPSILCEISFISNDAEVERLKTKEFQQDAAQAIYDGIVEILGIM